MQSTPLLTLSLLAVVAMPANVFVTAAGGIAPAAGNAVGVSRSSASIGEGVPVDVLGTTQVLLADDVAADDRLEVGADGLAVPLAAGIAVAVALEAGTAGDVIEVLLIPN